MRQCIKNDLFRVNQSSAADGSLLILYDYLKIEHASSSLHPYAKTQHQAHFKLSALCVPCHERDGFVMLPKVSIGLMSDASNHAVCTD